MVTSFAGDYEFASNFYEYEIVYQGITYPTSEHAYQAQKSLKIGERKYVASLKTPGQAKKYGRQIVLRPLWNKIKVPIMYDIIIHKFKSFEMSQKLLNTGKEILIEGNTWGDKFWGAVWNNGGWDGENHLGILLMLLRQHKQVEQILCSNQN